VDQSQAAAKGPCLSRCIGEDDRAPCPPALRHETAAVDALKYGLRVRVRGTLKVQRRTLDLVKHAELEVLGRDPMEEVVQDVMDR
jgi:hypothetical protein